MLRKKDRIREAWHQWCSGNTRNELFEDSDSDSEDANPGNEGLTEQVGYVGEAVETNEGFQDSELSGAFSKFLQGLSSPH